MGTQFASKDRAVIVDAPYAGFDYGDRPYREALHESAAPIRALIDAEAPLVVAFGRLDQRWELVSDEPPQAMIISLVFAEAIAVIALLVLFQLFGR